MGSGGWVSGQPEARCWLPGGARQAGAAAAGLARQGACPLPSASRRGAGPLARPGARRRPRCPTAQRSHLRDQSLEPQVVGLEPAGDLVHLLVDVVDDGVLLVQLLLHAARHVAQVVDACGSTSAHSARSTGALGGAATARPPHTPPSRARPAGAQAPTVAAQCVGWHGCQRRGPGGRPPAPPPSGRAPFSMRSSCASCLRLACSHSRSNCCVSPVLL
jgi:hypothetical protein